MPDDPLSARPDLPGVEEGLTALAAPPMTLPIQQREPSFNNYSRKSTGPLVDGIVFLVVAVLVLTVGLCQGCLHRKRKSPVQIRRCYSLVLVVSYTSVVMVLGINSMLFSIS